MIKHLLALALMLGMGMSVVYMHVPFMKEYDQIIEYNQQKNSYDLGEYYLGKLSPGQSVKLVFSRESGTPYDWDQVVVRASQGLKVSEKTGASGFTVTVEAEEEDENAWVEIYFVEEFMFRGTERIVFKLNVTKNAYAHDFVQENVLAGENSYYTFSVKSESLVDDVISAKLVGLPGAWSKPASAVVKSGDTIEVKIPVKATEEGKYPVTLEVQYASGLREDFQRELWVKPTMRSKMKSVGEGFVLVPGVLQPLYSIIGFMGSLL